MKRTRQERDDLFLFFWGKRMRRTRERQGKTDLGTFLYNLTNVQPSRDTFLFARTTETGVSGVVQGPLAPRGPLAPPDRGGKQGSLQHTRTGVRALLTAEVLTHADAPGGNCVDSNAPSA